MQVGGPAGVRLMAEEILFPFFGRFDFVCLVVCFHLLLAGFSSFILPLFSHYEQCPRKSESEMKFTKLISDGHLKPRKVWEQLCRVVFFRAYSKDAIHSTKIPTGPTGKSGPPQKVGPFFRNFSGWTEPIH